MESGCTGRVLICFDTNVGMHCANEDTSCHDFARSVLEELRSRGDVVICGFVLIEVFLKLCNGKTFPQPMSAREAGRYCQRLRENRNWRIVESGPVVADGWKWLEQTDFPFRRIRDVRLGLTLRHHGVSEFAKANETAFRSLGFLRVWNPLVPSS